MINFNFSLSYIQIYLLIINLFTFGLYLYDKINAIINKKTIQRVSEKQLLLFALLGGSIAALFSMILFRHKIKKISFLIKFFIVVVVDIFILYLIYRY